MAAEAKPRFEVQPTAPSHLLGVAIFLGLVGGFAFVSVFLRLG